MTAEKDFDLHSFLIEKYKDQDTVKIINHRQCYFYMQNNVFPLWTEAGYNHMVVYRFLREPTLKLFKSWREYEAEENNISAQKG